MRNNFIKLSIVAIFTLISATHNLLAQVTIGSNIPPLTGSLLDLKQNDKIGSNSNKGLGMPRVALVDTEDLAPCYVGTDPVEFTKHTGLTVYNTNDNTGAGGVLKEGVYFWDGATWQPLGEKGGQGYGPWYQVGSSPAIPSRNVDTDSYLDAKAVVGGSDILNNATLSVHGNTAVGGNLYTTGSATIGSTIASPTGAALNLQTQADDDPTNGGMTSNKGFLLPRVTLTGVNSLNPIVAGTPTDLVKKSYKGLQVYNVGAAVEGTGIRTWDGTQWLTMVTSIPPAEVVTSVIATLNGTQKVPLGSFDNPANAMTLDFGTLPINRDGSYALLIRFYGDVFSSATANTYLKNAASSSIYVWVFRSSQTVQSDASELSATMLPYGTAAGQGTAICAFTAALTIPDAKAGETFIVKICTNSSYSNFNLTLRAANPPSAARTSLFYWKL